MAQTTAQTQHTLETARPLTHARTHTHTHKELTSPTFKLLYTTNLLSEKIQF